MEGFNYLFTLIFSVEMIVKLFALRKVYFRDRWNIFDFMIVLASWFDFIEGLRNHSEQKKGSALSLFRAFRVARLLRLIKRFKSLWKIFYTFIKTMP